MLQQADLQLFLTLLNYNHHYLFQILVNSLRPCPVVKAKVPKKSFAGPIKSAKAIIVTIKPLSTVCLGNVNS